MQIIKKLQIIIVCCVCSFCSYAEESLGGLLFTSSEEKVDKRTSLVLFGDKLQKFEDEFSISFDLSIWNSDQFGHIFRVINKQRQEVEFVFVNFYGIDSMYLDFHSPITHKSVQIPVTKEDIDKKKILHINIDFNLKEDRADISIRNKTYSCSPVGLENPSFLQFAFGLYGLNLDVPQMLVRNLRIKEGNRKYFFFPLNESKGNFANDEKKKIKAPVKNPDWIVNKHFYWQAKSKFTVKNEVNITYDEPANRICFDGNDSSIYYFPRYNRLETKEIKKSVLQDEKGLLLHSNTFYSSTGDLYQFGGYENHSYSNKISFYDPENHCWTVVNFKGDNISPRFYSAVGDGVHPDEKLIFGGFGNETGREEHGGHNLYDLYLLNLKAKTITNLWRLEDIPKMQFVPSSNLVLSDDKKNFYALCYAHHIAKTVGYLYRFSLSDGSYEVTSDSINFNSEDTNTSVNLFYNRQMNEFYAVIQELTDNNTTQVQIFSLLSPPITRARLDSFAPIQKSYIVFFVLIVLIVLSALGLALWHFFFRKKEISGNIISHWLPEEPIEKRTPRPSSVYVFGNFTVYDAKGMDISYRFSMKLRSLFLLVLFNTSEDTGISTEKLTSTLWSDKDANSAKNIRGVTINRLRNILEDLDGITLVHQNHQWFFVFESPFYCDYLEYSDILQRLQNSAQMSYPDLLEQLVTIVKNGSFLSNVHDAGLDKYKAREEEKLEKLLREYVVYLYEEKQYQKVISISTSYFSVEPLNDEILNICIKSFNKLGKKEEAKTFLNNYKRNHKILTGEDYVG